MEGGGAVTRPRRGPARAPPPKTQRRLPISTRVPTARTGKAVQGGGSADLPASCFAPPHRHFGPAKKRCEKLQPLRSSELLQRRSVRTSGSAAHRSWAAPECRLDIPPGPARRRIRRHACFESGGAPARHIQDISFKSFV